jgi:hypothetical protein
MRKMGSPHVRGSDAPNFLLCLEPSRIRDGTFPVADENIGNGRKRVSAHFEASGRQSKSR